MTNEQRKIWLQLKLYGYAMARFFPVQLLLIHLKRSWLFLLFWFLLFGMAGGVLFRSLGIHYLFSTPEYLEEVSPISYLIIGAVLGLFTMAFHISSYIFYAHKFPFLATLARPLFRFSYNNSIIPISFFGFYCYTIAKGLLADEVEWMWIVLNILGMLLGVFISVSLTFSWFFSTLRPKVLEKIGETLDKTLRLVIVEDKSPSRLDLNGHHRVVTYLKNFYSIRWARDTSHYPKEDLVVLLQQHHSNAAIFLLLLTAAMLSMGWFVDQPFFMIPAGASIVLSMTFYLLVVGAVYSRFKGWSFALFLTFGLILNYASGFPQFQKDHFAFGLKYSGEMATYDIESLERLTTPQRMSRDRLAAFEALNGWRQCTGQQRPKLVIVNSSGGGLRSSLWSLAMLQQIDSTSDGAFWNQCFMATGSSGGMVGTSYFREIASTDHFRATDAYRAMGKDILNPIGFSLVSNDLFFSLKKFSDAGETFNYDRGWAFERQLESNLDYAFEERWVDYKEAERQGETPWIILSPTIINEGRRLLISNLGVSYLMRNDNPWSDECAYDLDGVDFFPFFKEQNGDSLRTSSALRMSATFPYITPLATLPSEPRMEVIDAGARDNNGFELSLRVVYEFREWIKANTSGVIFVQFMANEPPSKEIASSPYRTRFDALIKPIGGVVNSFANLQEFSAAEKLSYANEWIDFPLDIHTFQLTTSGGEEIALSWHLTEREKNVILENSNTEAVQGQIYELIDDLNRAGHN